ncbi:MAG: hypothetical protein NZ750_13400 [Anaerolineae bacterium]|nr:hypothetical protein [Anaerolineae bacterium]MDW8172795.1 hypothetical protein [Anaerolineae bacterium]
MDEAQRPPSKIDRLLDAIELVEANRKAEALVILRDLIREDADFADAWLWMSIAVDSADKSQVCLENVLRINPRHPMALAALARLRAADAASQRRRERLRARRDLFIGALWTLTMLLLFAILLSSVQRFWASLG